MLVLTFAIGFASTALKGITTQGRVKASLITGKSYVIDKNNIGGKGCNDTWPGTIDQPFCTIGPAGIVAQPGDGILFRGGIYPPIVFTKSGADGKYITLTTYNNEVVKIQGGTDGILLRGTSYVVVSGFDVSGATGNWLGGIRLAASSSVYPDHNIIEKNTVHDNIGTNTYGIVAEYATNTIIRENIVYNSYQSGIEIAQNNSIDPGHDLVGNEVTGNTVYGNVLAGGNADGIKAEGPRVKKTLIKNNIVYGNGDDGIDTWNSSENTLIGNISYNNKGPGDGNGFKLGGAVPGGNNTIIGNVAFGNKFNGFDSNGSGGNVYINNVAYDNAGFGFEDGWKLTSCTVETCKTTYINNIGYNNARANIGASKYTAISHNNLWFSDAGGAKASFDYVTYSTLTAFYKASGNRLDNPLNGDLSSLEVNPRFASLQVNGFRLLSDSPAINKGDNSNPGAIVTSDRVDIGAYEYGAPSAQQAASTPTPTQAQTYVASTNTPTPTVRPTATPTSIPTLTPTPTPANGPTITTSSLPRGDKGVYYSAKVSASDPTISDILTMTATGLPAGIVLDACTSTSGFNGVIFSCAIIGTSSKSGNFSPKFTVIDQLGHVGVRTIKLQIK